MQIRIRQAIARRKRSSVGDVWPILESAGTPPPGWKGWPDGKQFALVLTHDVETERGVERCRMIMDIEERLGFRSAFYFVPERYKVPADLRQEMIHRGFEVGVHGLRHDMTLYRSEREFKRQAQDINRYIKEWGAVGFRSPYMIRNLAWIRDHLNIEYDTSTFDTDPFEPQPEGVGTIFPFIVGGEKDGDPGYVELPCTLPQDLNLFVLLGETGIDVWQRKLDWIAGCGGMALFDTHPDYMQGGGNMAVDEYPVQFYEKFLVHVRNCDVGRCWCALPRDMSRFWFATQKKLLQEGVQEDVASYMRYVSVEGDCIEGKAEPPSKNNDRSDSLRICVIRHGRFPDDPRVRKEVNALLDAGYWVDVLCLRQDDSQPRREMKGALRITRIPVRHLRQSLFRYCWEYSASFLLFTAILTWRHFCRRYACVQVNTMPDALVFSTIIVRLSGTPVVLDVHEPTPELWVTKYGDRLKVLGKMQAFLLCAALKYADQIITVSSALKQRLVERGGPKLEITVIPNVTSEAFGSGIAFREMYHPDEFVLLTHGLIEARYGHELVIRAVHHLAKRIPQIRYEIIGEGEYLPELQKLAAELGCGDHVVFRGYLDFEELVQRIRSADVGVIAMRRSPYSELIDTNKMYEYMVLGVPVIHSRLPVVEGTFDSDAIEYFMPDDGCSLEEAILRLYNNPGRRRRMAHAAKIAVSNLTWEKVQRDYLSVLDRARCG